MAKKDGIISDSPTCIFLEDPIIVLELSCSNHSWEVQN